MKKLKKTLVLGTSLISLTLLTQCRETKKDTENSMENTIEEVENAAENVGDEIENTAEDVKDKFD